MHRSLYISRTYLGEELAGPQPKGDFGLKSLRYICISVCRKEKKTKSIKISNSSCRIISLRRFYFAFE